MKKMKSVPGILLLLGAVLAVVVAMLAEEFGTPIALGVALFGSFAGAAFAYRQLRRALATQTRKLDRGMTKLEAATAKAEKAARNSGSLAKKAGDQASEAATRSQEESRKSFAAVQRQSTELEQRLTKGWEEKFGATAKDISEISTSQRHTLNRLVELRDLSLSNGHSVDEVLDTVAEMSSTLSKQATLLAEVEKLGKDAAANDAHNREMLMRIQRMKKDAFEIKALLDSRNRGAVELGDLSRG